MNYYCNKHIPIDGKLLGDIVIGIRVEEVLGSGAPDSPAIFAAMRNLYFNSMEKLGRSF